MNRLKNSKLLNKYPVGIKVVKIVRIEDTGIPLNLLIFVQFGLWDLGKIRKHLLYPKGVVGWERRMWNA